MKILSPGSALLKGIPREILAMAPATPLIDLSDKKSPQSSHEAIYISEQLEPLQIVEQFIDRNIYSLLQINKNLFHEDLKILARLREDPQSYFDKSVKYLIPEHEESLILKFNDPKEKEGLRKKILNFASKAKGVSIAMSAESIFEELYMNAIIDAPKEAKKLNLSRPPYENGEKAVITLVKSDLYLAISCSDPFGSLDCSKVLKRLHEIYLQGAGEVINLKKGSGAGIGCSLMFENAASIILGVIPQKKTVVSCIIPLGLSNRQRSEVKKSLHLVQL